MKITCDPAKHAQNIAKHGLDFRDAAHVFAGRRLDYVDDRHNYGEVRVQTVGFLAGRMVMLVWTPRGEARHVISMRKCNAKEQKRYRQQFEAP